MSSFSDRRLHAVACVNNADRQRTAGNTAGAEAWMKEAERVASDIRFFARAMQANGEPFPAWALDYSPRCPTTKGEQGV